MTIKRSLVGLILGIVVILTALEAAWLLLSDAVLLGFIQPRLESAIGARISYQSPTTITRTFSPELSVTNLVITDNDQRYQFRTDTLKVQISLAKLLLGRVDISHLWLGETQIDLAQSTPHAVTDSKTTSDFVLPGTSLSLHDMRVASLSLVREGEASRLPKIDIDTLSIGLNAGSNALAVSSRLIVDSNPYDIKATLAKANKSSKTRHAVSISIQTERGQLALQGDVDFAQAAPSLDAIFSGRVTQLTRFIPESLGIEMPGEVTAKARLHGTTDQLAIEEIAADWHGPDASKATINGRIANVMQLAGFDLAFKAQLNKPQWLTPVLPKSMSELQNTEVSAKVTGDISQLAVREFNFNAQDTQQLDIALAGQVDLAQGPAGPGLQNMQLTLNFSAPTTRAARLLLFDSIPEFGAVTGRANVVSSKGAPALEDLVVQTKDSKGIAVELKGRIAQFPLSATEPNKGYDLNVSMQARATSLMGERIGLPLPVAGPLDVKFRIEGDTQSLQLNRISLNAGSKMALRVSATGKLLFGPWSREDPLQTVDLNLRAESADTQSVGKLIKQTLPEFGALSARARLHTVAGVHRLEQVQLHTNKTAPIQISVNGTAKKLMFIPKFAIDEIHAQLAAKSDDVAQLNAALDLNKVIPPIGPLEASAVLSGDDRTISLSEIHIYAGEKSILLVEADGRVVKFSAAQNWRAQDADVHVSATSTDSQALAKTLGYPWPLVGPLSGSAHIRDRNKLLALESVSVWVGDKAAPALAVNGAVGDLLHARQVQAKFSLDIDGPDLASYADSPRLRELKPLQGQMLISDTDGTLGIDSLHISMNTPPLLSVQVDGLFEDFKKPETLSFKSQLEAEDLKLVGALFDQHWASVGPVRFHSQLSQVPKGLVLKSSLVAAKHSLDTDLLADFTSSPPRLQGNVIIEQFFLPTAEKTSADESKAAPKKGPVFSSTPIDFSFLKKLDLDLYVDVKSFDDEQVSAESGNFKIILKSGDLSVNSAQLIYARGKIDFDAELHTANQTQPQLHFAAYGENINPWTALEMSTTSADVKDFKADVDISLKLNSSGSSQHELAANLGGDIYMMTKNGKIRRSLLNLVFVDLIGWTTTQVSSDKFALVDCGVSDFSIEQGIITTNALLLDSKNITITGSGIIDLAKEQIDYTVIPRKKSQIIAYAEPVHITGPLDDPKVQAIPWKSAASQYGTLIFGAPVFLGVTAAKYLFGEFNTDTADSPCVKYEKAHPLIKPYP